MTHFSSNNTPRYCSRLFFHRDQRATRHANLPPESITELLYENKNRYEKFPLPLRRKIKRKRNVSPIFGQVVLVLRKSDSKLVSQGDNFQRLVVQFSKKARRGCSAVCVRVFFNIFFFFTVSWTTLHRDQSIIRATKQVGSYVPCIT